MSRIHIGSRAWFAASALLHGLALAALLRAGPAALPPPRPPVSLVFVPGPARRPAAATPPAAAVRTLPERAADPPSSTRPARSRPARLARQAPAAPTAAPPSDPSAAATAAPTEAKATSLTAARPAGGAQWHCQADYPAAARRRGEEGTVVIRAAVAPDGHATAASVAQSSGHDALDAAATAAILRDCRFVPAMRDGRPIQGGVVLVPIVFRLDG